MPSHSESAASFSEAIGRLRQLEEERFSGSFRAEHESIVKVLYLSSGKLACASSTHPDDRLGTLLARERRITETQLDTAQDRALPGEALGSVLVNLGYIEPPPAYAQSSQRLRTPSQVLETAQGTCIDLGLTLAACLEYIGIHPVMFLMSGHSFPGYWRDDGAHEDFFSMAATLDNITESSIEEGEGEKGYDERERVFGYAKPYMIYKSSYREIIRAVDKGHLQPIESTFLTTKDSLVAACDQGVENLVDESSFDSMLDIARARRANVTPLPISGPL